ncbi:hypothetical protein HDU86_002579 [Geranomyces michiganensis]|nr:hypothetical protein HDU86_002579 [Geranomyces michiganensis]
MLCTTWPSSRLPRKIQDFDQPPKLFKALWNFRVWRTETSLPKDLFTDAESDCESEDSVESVLLANYKRPCLSTPTKYMSVK